VAGELCSVVSVVVAFVRRVYRVVVVWVGVICIKYTQVKLEWQMIAASLEHGTITLSLVVSYIY
jgi:hypothetical protein